MSIPFRAPHRAHYVPLGVSAALTNAAMAVTSAAATLVVSDRLDVAWAALPATAGILGTGLGSVALARHITRQGYRRGLRLGYLLAVAGGVVCVAVTAWPGRHGSAVPALVAGMFLLGIGNASAQLTRYVAAELQPPERRAGAISAIVWIVTVGAVGGPALLGTGARVAAAAGLPADAGPFLLGTTFVLLAALAASAVPAGRPTAATPTTAPRLFDHPSTRHALLAMASAQVIMVAVMTAAPVDMHMHGTTTVSIGAVLAAHTFGMFAFSPLTGVAVGRFGSRTVIRAGLVVLMVTSTAAALTQGAGQAIALLLLGFGWNLCYIGGTALLAADLDVNGRLAVEGRVDATVWVFAAGAGLLSTMLLSLGGAGLIAVFAAAAALAPYLAGRTSGSAEREAVRS